MHTLSSLLQAIGRAGRDGMPAKCELFYTSGNESGKRENAGQATLTWAELESALKKVFDAYDAFRTASF